MSDNITKIKYTVVNDKLYSIKSISFYKMEIVAVPCDKSIADVPEEEIFPLGKLIESFKIRIEN